MKMHKRVLKVAVVSALAVAFAVPAFANPFTDVPAKHWSYDAVNKLAQAGVIDGYGDGTFKGDKTMTRYEMAQIVAKAMTKSLNADQQASVDKLTREYAAELNTLGVKVDGMQNQIDKMVKVSGDVRLRYSNVGDGTDGSTNSSDLANYNPYNRRTSGDTSNVRARVAFDGKVNDNLSFNTRLSSNFNPSGTNSDVNVKLDTASVTYKAFTAGRQDVKLGSGILMDDTLNGVALKTGGLKLYAGKTTGISDTDDRYIDTNDINNPFASVPANQAYTTNAEKMFGAEYTVGTAGHVQLTGDYLKIDDNKAYGINAALPLGKALTVQGDFVRNISNDASATAIGVKINPIGVTVTHRDADAGVYNAYSNYNTSSTMPLPIGVAIKGMEYKYDTKLGKNADLNVTYQDFDHMDTRTSAAVSVKF